MMFLKPKELKRIFQIVHAVTPIFFISADSLSTAIGNLSDFEAITAEHKMFSNFKAEKENTCLSQ